MISSTSMKNVWLSMEHQAILWCNQLVVQVGKNSLIYNLENSVFNEFEDLHLMQVSHTLLSLVDSKSGQPFSDSQTRLWILTRMLQSALAQSFNGMTPMKVSHELPILASKGINTISALNIYIFSLY